MGWQKRPCEIKRALRRASTEGFHPSHCQGPQYIMRWHHLVVLLVLLLVVAEAAKKKPRKKAWQEAWQEAKQAIKAKVPCRHHQQGKVHEIHSDDWKREECKASGRPALLVRSEEERLRQV